VFSYPLKLAYGTFHISLNFRNVGTPLDQKEGVQGQGTSCSGFPREDTRPPLDENLLAGEDVFTCFRGLLMFPVFFPTFFPSDR